MPRFNPRVARLAPPPVPSVHAWGRAYDGACGPLIDLSQAVPGYPAHPDMLRWLGEAAASPSAAGYGPITGEAALREAYATHVSALYGARIGAENIQITAGCNQAFLAAVLALAGPGETVLLSNPFYFNHATTLAMLGIGVETFACTAENGFLPDPEALRAVLHPGVKALVLVSPNNPTGAIYPPGLIAEIFALCRANETWLILDETYRDFLEADGPPHGLFSRAQWREGFIGLYSFSKSFCIPGHRLGAITASAEVVGEIVKIMDNMQICAPRAGQIALARALPALAGWRAENRAEIARRAVALRGVMAQVPEWPVEAMGAYFAYVRHPWPGVGSVEAARQLATQAGIVCIPGDFFGPDQGAFLRFAFANADVSAISALAARLRQATPPVA